MALTAFYTDEFVLPLPSGHRFPMQKYRMLRQALQAQKGFEVEFRIPRVARPGELALVHCPRYIEAVCEGGLSAEQQKSIGFPWSKAMVERSLRSVGATLEATDVALTRGASVNLAGGTHHASRQAGSGFCVFNDVAVAARAFQAKVLAGRHSEPNVLVVDLDVHQGDGTAQIFKDDPSVFTFSMHGQANFPFQKAVSDLDVPLEKGCGDEDYLHQLELALAEIESRFRPDLIYYLAGMDVHREDRLGLLELSDAAVYQRDVVVLDFALRCDVPVVMSMAGGYFHDLDHLVALQASSISRLEDFAVRWQKQRGLIPSSCYF